MPDRAFAARLLAKGKFVARTLVGFALATTALHAHVVSMSTGELRVDGPTAVYELRMPMVEIATLANPETVLMDHVRFANAIRTSVQCHPEDATYVCEAAYEFPGLFDRLDVECTLYRITVPNHVHLLTAMQGPRSDQAVFDQSFTRAEVRFHSPSPAEVIARDLGAGSWRALTSAAGMLFLASLVIAARSGREAVLFLAMFIAGEWTVRWIAPRLPWQFSPRFLEAAMALTVAYLAIEILLLPEAGMRWMVVLAIGLLHGLYFAGYPGPYLAGAAIFQIVLVTLLYFVIRGISLSVRRGSAWILLASGLGWFALRVVR